MVDPISVTLGVFISSVFTNIVSARVDRHILDVVFDRRVGNEIKEALCIAYRKAIDENVHVYEQSVEYATLTKELRQQIPALVNGFMTTAISDRLFFDIDDNITLSALLDVSVSSLSEDSEASEHLFGVLKATEEWVLLPRGLKATFRTNLLGSLFYNFVEGAIKRDPKVRDAVFFQQFIDTQRQLGATDDQITAFRADVRAAFADLANDQEWAERVLSSTERIEGSVSLIADQIAEGQRRQEAERQQQLGQEFALIRRVSELHPEDFRFEKVQPGGEAAGKTSRPFYDSVYIPRKFVPYHTSGLPSSVPVFPESFLVEELRQGNSIALLGVPLAGKTRTLYQVVSHLEDYWLLRPHADRSVPSDDAFAMLQSKKVIVVLDDLHTYARPTIDLVAFCRKLDRYAANWAIIATCRSGVITPEKSELGAVLAARGTGLRDVYDDIPWKLQFLPLTAAERGLLYKQIGRKGWQPGLSPVFPTPGHITMADAMRYMRSRFDELSREQQDLLQAMRLLLDIGLMTSPVRLGAIIQGFFGRQSTKLSDNLDELAQQGFLIQHSQDYVLAEPAYLLHLFTFKDNANYLSRVDKLVGMLETIADVEGLTALAARWFRQQNYSQALALYDRALYFSPDNTHSLIGKGVTLGKLSRQEEALAIFDRALEIHPKSFDARTNRGVALGELGRHDEALVALDHALLIYPDDPNGLANRAMSLTSLGRHHDALETINRALTKRNNYVEALHIKSIVLSKLGNLDEALAILDYVLELRPDDPGALANKGNALNQLGRHEEALSILNHALSLRDNQPEAWFNKSLALGALGRSVEELKALDKAVALRPNFFEAWYHRGTVLCAIQRFDDALAALDGALELCPDNLDVLTLKGAVLNELGRNKEALAVLDYTTSIQDDLPTAWYNKGITYSSLGYEDDANQAFTRAIHLELDRAETLITDAEAQNSREHFVGALASLDRVLSITTNNVAVLTMKGVVQGKAGLIQEALATLEQASELDSASFEILVNLGVAFGKLGREEEALMVIDRALMLRSDEPIALVNKAAALNTLVRYSEALAVLDQAQSLESDNPVAWQNRGVALNGLERFEEALVSLDQALAINPQFPDALNSKGLALLRLEQFEEALKAFENAVELQPDHPGACYNRGVTLAQLDHYDEAKEWLEKAQQYPSTSQAATQALEELTHNG